MATKSKVFKYAKAFKGEVKLTDFELVDEGLAALRDGQFLAQAIYLTVDPYLRNFMASLPTGSTMAGRQVAR